MSFVPKLFKPKLCSLEIEAQGTDGLVRKFEVKYNVGLFGRVKILNEKELPPQIVGKYKQTLLAAFLSCFDYKIADSEIGWRLVDEAGKIYQYEFLIKLPDGTEGIPYKKSLMSSTRNFLDMRNMLLSKNLNGAKISLRLNEVVLDLRNSSVREITQTYRSFSTYNLDGSQSCAYISDSPVKKEHYQRDEQNYDLQQQWLYRNYLRLQQQLLWRQYAQFQISAIPARNMRHQNKNLALAEETVFARQSVSIAGIQKNDKALDSCFVPQDESMAFPLHLLPLSDFMQPDGIRASSLSLRLPSSTISAAMAKESRSISSEGKKQAQKSHHSADGSKEERDSCDRRETGGNEHFDRQSREDSDDENSGRGRKKPQENMRKPAPLSSLKNFRAAIFDLDGVVVNSEGAHLQSFNELLAPLGVKISRKEWNERYTGIGSRAIFRDVCARNNLRGSVEEWVAKRSEVYHDVVVRNGLKETQGFSSFFKLLEKNGIKCAIASGGHKPHILESMMAINMPRVEFVGLEDVKNAKPSPETFLLAAQKLKVKPSECIVFEDSLAGMRAAAAAGMPCVALSTTLPRAKIVGKAALIVNNFASPVLKKSVAKLLAKSGAKKKAKAQADWLFPEKRKKTGRNARRKRTAKSRAQGRKAKSRKIGGKAARSMRK